MTAPKNDGSSNACPICLAQIKADSEGRGLTMDEYISAAREAMKSGDFC